MYVFYLALIRPYLLLGMHFYLHLMFPVFLLSEANWLPAVCLCLYNSPSEAPSVYIIALHVCISSIFFSLEMAIITVIDHIRAT